MTNMKKLSNFMVDQSKVQISRLSSQLLVNNVEFVCVDVDLSCRFEASKPKPELTNNSAAPCSELLAFKVDASLKPHEAVSP